MHPNLAFFVRFCSSSCAFFAFTTALSAACTSSSPLPISFSVLVTFSLTSNWKRYPSTLKTYPSLSPNLNQQHQQQPFLQRQKRQKKQKKMGCGGSKLETLEPVSLCRDRSILLESVIRHRYTLSNAHFSYLRSLASVGIALQRCFESISPPPPLSSSSSYLPNQNQQKSDSVSHAEIPYVNQQSGAHSKSHMDLNSDSDSVSEISTPVHEHVHGRGNDHGETLDQNPGMNCMQTRPAEPSVVYQQQSSETVRVEEDPSLSGYGFAYPNPISYSYPYPYPYSHPYAYSNQYSYPYPYSNYGVGYGGHYGYSFPPQFDQSSYVPPPCPAPDSSPTRAAPPQYPPPAEASWDFLNPFYENRSYYRAYTPSRDSEELREEEGIPDLEEVVDYDEIEQEQVSDVEEDAEIEREEVKEVEEEKKTVVDGGAGGGEDLEKVADKSDAENVVEESGGDVNLNMVEEDEIVVIEDENLHDGGGVGAAVMNAQLEVSDVLREIKAQFYIASESGNEVSKLLEVGKVPYRGRNAVYKVSSKTLDVVAPPFSVVSSQPSSSRSTKSTSSAEKNFNVDEYIMVNSRNLSSTLKKLYIWEKKLHEQVKAEEKLRIIYDRKRKQLKHMDERGVEPHKLVSTQTFVRKLSDKLKIAIQVVDSISSTITKLRDEELWLQINELIHGLGRMWKVMLECHQSQCRLISEANNLDSIASGGMLIDAHKEATMQLELELLKWLSSFYAWISAQKAYIRTLNEWLLKCLHYVPEETDDGIAPYSPGQIGAPPVFVICNHWSQAMERLSENEVFTAMQTFSISVLQLWEQHYEEQRQRMMTNNDMKRRLKSLESDIQKVKKAFGSVNKKLLMVSEQSGIPLPGQLVHCSVTTNVSSLQYGLKQIFEAMDKFSAESMEVYEELRKRSEEQLATESSKIEGPGNRVADKENPASVEDDLS